MRNAQAPLARRFGGCRLSAARSERSAIITSSLSVSVSRLIITAARLRIIHILTERLLFDRLIVAEHGRAGLAHAREHMGRTHAVVQQYDYAIMLQVRDAHIPAASGPCYLCLP